MSDHRAPLGRHLWRGFCVVLAATLLTYLLHDALHGMETANLDRWLRVRAGKPSSTIALVAITDQNYAEMFKATSPLNQAAVESILAAAAAAGPKLIVVDLDTSHWTQPKTSYPAPVLWAQDVWEVERGAQRCLAVGKALGGDAGAVQHGLPAFRPAQDGIVRDFLREVKDECGFRAPSLVTRAVELAAWSPDAHEAANEERINFLGQRYSFPTLSAHAVLRLAESKDWLAANELKGKLVILGGTFRAARDKYRTPVGYLDGMEVLAHAIESARRPIAELGKFTFALIDLLIGMALVYLTWRVSHWVSLPVMFLGIPAVAVLASFAVFHTSGYFASFVPVVAGVFVHELLEHVLHHRHLVHENRQLRAQLQQQQDGA